MAAYRYEKLSAEDQCDRSRAAAAIIKQISKSKDESAWETALDNITSGLNSSDPITRLGFAEALTHYLAARGSDNVNIEELVKKLPTVSKNSNEEFQDSADAALLAVTAILDVDALTWPSTTLEDYKSIVDYLLNVLPEDQDENDSFTEAVFLRFCILIQLLKDTNIDLGNALEYTFAQIDKKNFTLTPCVITLYLTITPEQGLLYGSLKNGWVSGNPLAKGNFPNLTKVLRETISESLSGSTQDSKTSKAFNTKSKKQKSQESSHDPLKFSFVWKKIAYFYLNMFKSSNGATTTKKSKTDKKASSKSKKTESSPVEFIGFEEFWKTLVDDSLFSNSSSVDQRIAGVEIFSIFIRVLKDAPESILKYMFSPNLIKALTNTKQSNKFSQSSVNQFLKSVKSLSSTIIEVGKTSPTLAVTFLDAIYSSKNSHNFDQATKTKTVQELSNNLTAESTAKLITFFTRIILDPFEQDPRVRGDTHLVDSRRKWALDRITNLIKSPLLVASEDTQWLNNLFDILIRYGFFEPTKSSKSSKKDKSKDPKDSKKRKHDEAPASANGSLYPDPLPPFSQQFVSQLQERTALIVASSVSFKPASDGVSWPYRALSKISKLEAPDSGYKCLVEFSGEILRHKNKTVSTLEKIRNKRQSSPHVDTPQLSAFEMLFSLVLFQLYSGETESGGVLDELQACYNSIQSQSEAEEGGDERSVDGNEVDPTLVLTEILLSFISRESASLRKVSETVWKTFSSQVTKESLQRLYDVIVAQESAEGQSELFDNLEAGEYVEESELDEEEDENESDQEKEDREAADQEMGNGNGELSDSESDDEEEASDNGKEESQRDQIEQIEEDSRRKLALALGLKSGSENNDGEDSEMKDALSNEASDDDSDDNDDDDDDDISMNDEQMAALDEQLGAIFRERRSALLEHSSKNKERKKEAKIARHNMVMFKTRIVDFLDIFVNQQGSESPLFLTMILPLLNAVSITKNKGLGEKIVSLLKKEICKIKVTDKMISKIKRESTETGITFTAEDEDDDAEDTQEKEDNQDEEMEEVESMDDKITKINETENDLTAVSASDIIAWIQEIHNLAWKTNITPLSQCCNQASVFLSKLLLQVDESYLKYVLSIYTSTLQDWITRRQNRVTIAMFNDFLNWAYTYRQKKVAEGSNTLKPSADSSKKTCTEKEHCHDDEKISLESLKLTAKANANDKRSKKNNNSNSNNSKKESKKEKKNKKKAKKGNKEEKEAVSQGNFADLD